MVDGSFPRERQKTVPKVPKSAAHVGLPPVKVRPGQALQLRLQLQLPPGAKLTEGAPSCWFLEANGMRTAPQTGRHCSAQSDGFSSLCFTVCWASFEGSGVKCVNLARIRFDLFTAPSSLPVWVVACESPGSSEQHDLRECCLACLSVRLLPSSSLVSRKSL